MIDNLLHNYDEQRHRFHHNETVHIVVWKLDALVDRIRELERQRDMLADKLACMCSVSSRETCGVPEPCPYSKGFTRCLDVEKEEWIQVIKGAKQ